VNWSLDLAWDRRYSAFVGTVRKLNVGKSAFFRFDRTDWDPILDFVNQKRAHVSKAEHRQNLVESKSLIRSLERLIHPIMTEHKKPPAYVDFLAGTIGGMVR
jgi:hypothetical protein